MHFYYSVCVCVCGVKSYIVTFQCVGSFPNFGDLFVCRLCFDGRGYENFGLCSAQQ